VLIDTGLQTGTDVFKTIALGAHGAGFVTAMFFALEYRGSDGVFSLISKLTAKHSRVMAATGCPSIDDI
jgi:(S)-2-hydroxy-acid oxidase/4-hydroxymandelate oxidase